MHSGFAQVAATVSIHRRRRQKALDNRRKSIFFVIIPRFTRIQFQQDFRRLFLYLGAVFGDVIVNPTNPHFVEKEKKSLIPSAGREKESQGGIYYFFLKRKDDDPNLVFIQIRRAQHETQYAPRCSLLALFLVLLLFFFCLWISRRQTHLDNATDDCTEEKRESERGKKKNGERPMSSCRVHYGYWIFPLSVYLYALCAFPID